MCNSPSFQAEYEVTPDEKRKECGQELLDKYLNTKVQKRIAQEGPKTLQCVANILRV